ncbi:unnamed protein product, partial [Polarella glacialis]
DLSHRMSSEPSELECAICFESITASTILPCSCKVPYCETCWDKALARSFLDCGRSRCPTCRSAVRVDFDAETLSLVFSKESDDGVTGEAPANMEEALRIQAAHNEAINRLVAQAIPAQIRLLSNFGTQHESLRTFAENPQEQLSKLSASTLKQHITALGGSAEGCLEKSDLVQRVQEAAGSQQVLAGYWAACSGESPACVCRSSLKRVTGLDRARHFCQRRVPDHPPGSRVFEEMLARITRNGRTSVICDLCEEVVMLGSGVWTCENSDSTILHATQYDVCEKCFVRHALGKEED